MTVIVRKDVVLKKTGWRSHASIYQRMEKGLFTKNVKIGLRSSGWPLHEVEALVKAMSRGDSEEKVRALVAHLHARRMETSEGPLVDKRTASSEQDRLQLAAAALQGLLANPRLAPEILKRDGCTGGWIETSAWAFADAMLRAREKS